MVGVQGAAIVAVAMSVKEEKPADKANSKATDIKTGAKASSGKPSTSSKEVQQKQAGKRE